MLSITQKIGDVLQKRSFFLKKKMKKERKGREEKREIKKEKNLFNIFKQNLHI